MDFIKFITPRKKKDDTLHMFTNSHYYMYRG